MSVKNIALSTLLIISYLTFSYGQWGLENLGEQISAQVQNSLRPLEGLGARINAQVQRSLRPLDGLGQQIEEQVYQSLEPVRVLEAQEKIKNGMGGTTVVTFSPSGKTFIKRNGVLFECSGTISSSNGDCSGQLTRYKITKNEDYCYQTSRAIINNYLCFSSSSYSITTGYINGRITCESGDGSSTLLIKSDDYKKMCENIATKASYTFYTTNDFLNPGNKLNCSGSNPKICTLEEDLTRNLNSGGTFITGNFQNVVITN